MKRMRLESLNHHLLCGLVLSDFCGSPLLIASFCPVMTLLSAIPMLILEKCLCMVEDDCSQQTDCVPVLEWTLFAHLSCFNQQHTAFTAGILLYNPIQLRILTNQNRHTADYIVNLPAVFEVSIGRPPWISYKPLRHLTVFIYSFFALRLHRVPALCVIDPSTAHLPRPLTLSTLH
jgi:hypothetical protein